MSKGSKLRNDLSPNLAKNLLKAIPGLTIDKVRMYLSSYDIDKNSFLDDMQMSTIYKKALTDPDIIRARQKKKFKFKSYGLSVAVRKSENDKKKPQWVSFVSIPFGGMNKKY